MCLGRTAGSVRFEHDRIASRAAVALMRDSTARFAGIRRRYRAGFFTCSLEDALKSTLVTRLLPAKLALHCALKACLHAPHLAPAWMLASASLACTTAHAHPWYGGVQKIRCMLHGNADADAHTNWCHGQSIGFDGRRKPCRHRSLQRARPCRRAGERAHPPKTPAAVSVCELLRRLVVPRSRVSGLALSS